MSNNISSLLGRSPHAILLSSDQKKKEKKITSFYFSKEFHLYLKMFSVKTGRPMSDIIEEAVYEYIKKEEEKAEKGAEENGGDTK